MNRSRARRFFALVVLLLSLGATLALRAREISHKYTITHDEGISLLAATCHEGSFERVGFGLRPVSAVRWKEFLQIDERFCYGRIRADLAHVDIHPPLYFWILHSWFLVFDPNTWSGAALNLPIAFLTTLFLFLMARYVLRSDAEAALVAFTYALSPAVVSVSAEARGYDLLALWAVLAVWATFRATDLSARLTSGRLLLLGTLIALGALTHFHFLFVAAGCVVFASWRLKGRHPRREATVPAAIGAGYLAAILIHLPFGPLARHAGQNEAISLAGFLDRFWRVVSAFDAFTYVALLLPLIAIWLLSGLARDRASYRGVRVRSAFSGFEPLFFMVWIGGATILFYLAHLSQVHAMGPKYLSMTWPFVAFVPVALIRAVPQLSAPLTVYFFLAPTLFGFALPLSRTEFVDLSQSLGYLQDASVIVIDSRERGVLPRLVWHAPTQAAVIAADQPTLISDAMVWLPHLGDDAVYLSQISDPNTRTQTQEILALIDAAGYELEASREGVLGLGLVYQVRRTR